MVKRAFGKSKCWWNIRAFLIKVKAISSVVAALLIIAGVVLLLCILPVWVWGVLLAIILIAIGIIILIAWW